VPTALVSSKQVRIKQTSEAVCTDDRIPDQQQKKNKLQHVLRSQDDSNASF